MNMDDSDWAPGKLGNALEFDGNDDYVLHGGVGDPTSTATTEITVITHIIPDSGGTDDRYIIAQEGTASRKFSLHLNSSNQVVGRVYRTDSDYVELVSSSVIVADGQTPSCVILTVDTLLKSGNVKLYINYLTYSSWACQCSSLMDVEEDASNIMECV